MKITPEEVEALGLKKSKKTSISMCIIGDVNDGDEIESSNEIDTFKNYKVLSEIADKINNYNNGYNWSKRNTYLTDKEINVFEEYVPHLDNDDVHTICSIEFTYIIDGVLYE